MSKVLQKIWIMVLIMAILPFSSDIVKAQEEMRAVWISTVYNLDYPSQKNDIQAQKQEFIDRLEQLKAIGINTVIVQVRPKADALYSSAINPWSDVLTGTQGQNPGYDPMAFMIEQAHKRGMAFHAWLNPYRVTTTGTDLTKLCETHPARIHSDWVLSYKNALFYNPELMAVKEHIRDTVKEIVTNYDVDGIHFDDYFYPSQYPLPEGEGKDGTVANSRRTHVTEMVKMTKEVIQSIKPNVVFGISPQGIWKNSSSDVTGSNTNGSECYYAVFSDVRNWITNNYIDYVVPQIYWETGHKAADYETLVSWWANEVNGKNVKLYIGQGIYKDTVAEQIDTQLQINSKYNSVQGSFYFSMKELLNNRKDCQTKIKNFYSSTSSINTPDVTQPEQNPVGTETIVIPQSPVIPQLPPTNSLPDDLAEAIAATSKVLIDTKEQIFEAYNIEGSHYFKLRDIAKALSNTEKQFEIAWEEKTNTINIISNKEYTATSDELGQRDGKNKKASFTTAQLLLDGKAVPITAYNIEGSNYYKLRDLGSALNFNVKWEEKSKIIDIMTNLAYQQ